MRIATDTARLDLPPGESAELGVDVTNTGDLIDGVSARLIGVPAGNVIADPPVLPLFPDATGRLVLTLTLPTDFPAGRHALSVEVSSRTQLRATTYSDLDLVVPQQPGLRMAAQQTLIRSRRSARFVLALTNTGNVGLTVTLSAADAERLLTVQCIPAVVTVPAGATIEPIVAVTSRRMLLGNDLDRPITVNAVGTPSVAPPLAPTAPHGVPEVQPVDPDRPSMPDADDGLDGAPPPPAEARSVLTYRHRPWFTRGVLTALILLMIIALWATVFLFGIAQVFSGDPLTKTTPGSFYASVGASQATATATAPAGTDPAAEAAAAAAAAPAGALPKEGPLPAGVGGSIAGTVIAASNNEPVGRILVEARRQKRDGSWVAVSSAASQADGSFEVAGLFPGPYVLALSAVGYLPSFAPATPDVGTADRIKVTAGQVATGITAVITGNDATITGKVDPGETLQQVVTTVTVRPISGAGPGEPVATADTDTSGAYTLGPLKAPFTYELTFLAPGYQPSTLRTTVDGGAQRFEPTVLLGTDTGSVSGLVTDGTTPLGGVAVATTVAGKELVTGTPTTGTVGSFIVGDLPTPANYVITFTAEGYATRTVVVDLGPGENLTTPNVVMVGGTGTVTGRLVDSAGNGLGGAVVTVGGAANPPTTTTVTDGNVGGFTLSGLPSPGSYTVTFTLAGYADQTVPVTLSSTAASAPLQVTMASSLGRITGQVLDSQGTPTRGINVSATDGRRIWPSTTTAASGGLPDGGYLIDQLPAGSYTITATSASGQTSTALVRLTAGGSVTQNFALPAG